MVLVMQSLQVRASLRCPRSGISMSSTPHQVQRPIEPLTSGRCTKISPSPSAQANKMQRCVDTAVAYAPP